ncbi:MULTISPECIES: carbohydrate-binding protein [unclassified Streptomyces]|uniref:carbohydrate-binding protein n=1 Tax=unclassified Streptomyces TaxID=2593676 RepID=UPI0033AD07FB
MRRMKSTAAALGAATVLILACGLGSATATAAPVHGHVVAARQQAAGVCTSAAADSGRTVRGALSRDQVHHELSGLTEPHRAARGYTGSGAADTSGIADKGPLRDGAPDRGLLTDIHPAQGTSFKAIDGSDGSCATQSVSAQLTVQEGSTTIYTPTMYPAGGSCIELVTVYTLSGRSVSAWDWCNSVAFEASVPIDSAFLSTYTDGGSSAYTGRVVKTDAATNSWTAGLYNYRTGSWDTLFTQSGQNQSGRNTGWDINELYSQVGTSGRSDACVDMAGQTFESSNITVRINGSWTRASADNSDTTYDSPAGSFYCPDRTYQMVSAYDHWKAVG